MKEGNLKVSRSLIKLQSLLEMRKKSFASELSLWCRLPFGGEIDADEVQVDFWGSEMTVIGCLRSQKVKIAQKLWKFSIKSLKSF